MKTFTLFFRMDILTPEAQPTKEQMDAYMQDWMKWINSISEKGQLAEGGNHLAYEGKVIRPDDVIEDKPYSINRESISGYILVDVADINEAVKIGLQCPILNGKGTSVEVREALKLN